MILDKISKINTIFLLSIQELPLITSTAIEIAKNIKKVIVKY
jgi:hypothetical protein